ncbi:MAG: tyrosine-type recombinase/integrase [Magnetovibrionaceae bacterium]
MLKKKSFNDEEIPIYDEAVIYKRGDYWQFRMWLNGEGKYARKSLRTRSKTTAIERGKDAYLEIYANIKQGKTYFSITTKEGVEKYLAHRKKDVELGHIVKGRFGTISIHLNHWLDFIGRDTKLKELDRSDCEDYFYERSRAAKGKVKQLTVQNEQSTINACMKWLFKNNETHVDGFDFKKQPKIDTGDDSVRRATFTNDEYVRVIRQAKAYSAQKANKIDEDEHLIRSLVRFYILIAANSGLRVGEQMQLRWSDVSVVRVKRAGEERALARIRVRAATSKVRKSREFMCRNGQYFERLKELTKPEAPNDLIFSTDGESPITKRTLLYHFHKIVELAEIENREDRDLVPYSLRHFMITQRIMSGLSYGQIADMCGTSATQVENTYKHVNDEMLRTNAMADYRRRSDGTIEPIS